MNTTTKEWSINHKSLPIPLSSHSSIEVEGLIVVIGGYNLNDRYSNRVFIMDPNRNEWIENTPINIECDSHQSYMIDSKIFIIGGLNGNETIKEVQIGQFKI